MHRFIIRHLLVLYLATTRGGCIDSGANRREASRGGSPVLGEMAGVSEECPVDPLANRNEWLVRGETTMLHLPAEMVQAILAHLPIEDYASFVTAFAGHAEWQREALCMAEGHELAMMRDAVGEYLALNVHNEADRRKRASLRRALSRLIVKRILFEAAPSAPLNGRLQRLADAMEATMRDMRALSDSERWMALCLEPLVGHCDFVRLWRSFLSPTFRRDHVTAAAQAMAAKGMGETIKGLFGHAYYNRTSQQLLPLAFQSGNKDFISDLLCNSDFKRQHRTQARLEMAARFGNLDILASTLPRGDGVSRGACNVDEVFIAACSGGHVPVIEYLWQHHRPRRPVLTHHRAFIAAVENGNLPTIRLLLDDYWRDSYDPASFDSEGLIIAAGRGYLDLVQYLLQPKVSADGTRRFVNVSPGALSNEALCRATRNGHLRVVQYLMTIEDASINIADQQNGAVIEAAAGGHVDILRYFVEQKTAGNAKFARLDFAAQDNLAVRRAAGEGRLEVVQLLLSGRCGLVDPSAMESEALLLAAGNGHAAVVAYLLQCRAQGGYAGIDPAAQNNRAVIDAAANGHVEVLRMLLQRDATGAHIYPRMDAAAQNNRAVVEAATNGRAAALEFLLQQRDDDGDGENRGEFVFPGISPEAQAHQALVNAVLNRRVDCIRLLLGCRRRGQRRFALGDPTALDYRLVKFAIAGGHWPTITALFLGMFGLEPAEMPAFASESEQSMWLMQVASERGHLDLAGWLAANQAEARCDPAALAIRSSGKLCEWSKYGGMVMLALCFLVIALPLATLFSNYSY